MSLEAWGTVASVGTFAVITATAIAALVQLRHLRAANQLTAWHTWATAYEGSELRSSFDFVRTELAQRLEDPSFREELRNAQLSRTRHPEIMICNFFDQWGLYYRLGAIDRDAFMRVNHGIIMNFWELLAPVVALLADPTHGNITFQQFEYLTAEAQRWRQHHPQGDYPSGAPRMPLIDRYGEIDGVSPAPDPPHSSPTQ